MRLPSNAVLMTGGTGFVGSYLAVELLKRGAFVVFLARGQRDTTARERIDDLMLWHEYADPDSYAVQDGDVASPRFGLSDEDYADLARSCREIWHCASETSFSPTKQNSLERVNVGGTRHMVTFAADSGSELVNHVSTAYSVGRISGRCEETLVARTDFCNPYEATKHAAEMVVADECGKAGIPYLIYRPSIIVGETGSGRTLQFKGMYYPLGLLDYMRTMFLLDLKENNGENAGQMGVRLNDDGTIFLPLRLATGGDADSPINLVPIDFVVDACLRIHADGTPGRIYNIAHDTPVTVAEVISFINDYMSIVGVSVVHPDAFVDAPENALERRFQKLMKVYLPYLSDRRLFSMDNTGDVLVRHGVACPPVDGPLLQRCVSYAMDLDWKPPFGRH
jgi:nucleoside-diphosphate-sugar epimerase